MSPEALVQRRLVRLMLLAVVASLATIALKTVAWLLTGSVGLLSDAAESVVNLVASLFGLVAVQWAARPPDDEHEYGHEKANYLAAGVEGTLILVAAVTIMVSAVDRLLNPAPISTVGLGLVVSAVASAINLAVGLVLLRVGRRDRSLVLEADGKHLLTDVWTSVGVIAGVAAVAISGWDPLDALVAIAVAINIVVAGVGLVRRSAAGLMDRALSADERAGVQQILDDFSDDQVDFHALRTRRSGRRAFITFHLLVPGAWSVQEGHDFAERVEHRLRVAFEPATVTTHLEPVEDPVSFADMTIDRPVDRAPGESPAG